MTPRDLEEYRALRDTIRQRGTTRVWVFLAGLVAWAGLAVATAALAALPVATLLPLLVLAGVFEAIASLHVGVERIGRYIEVFFESDQGDQTPELVRGWEPGWEHVTRAYGRAFPRTSPDPLFALVFIGATVLNFVPVLLAEPVVIEIVVVGTVHLLFLIRILVARRAAGRQRAIDLERFLRVKREMQMK